MFKKDILLNDDEALNVSPETLENLSNNKGEEG